MTGAEIIARARQELGTPWQHQARLSGVAVDCHGFLGVVARDCGVAEAQAWLADDALKRYSRIPRPSLSLAGARRYLDEIKVRDAVEADILFLALRSHPELPTHFAIITRANPLTIIHAEYFAGRVVENGLRDGSRWFPTHAFRFRGLS